MKTTNLNTSSVFATASTSQAEVAALIEIGVPLMDAAGTVPWAKIEAATGIKYSRGWLIVRRAYLEANMPELLVDTQAFIQQAQAKAKEANKLSEFNPDRDVVSDLAAHLREAKCSWGEIAVRLGLPESKVRTAYKLKGGKKDLGLRIGKGGRFAYDDPTLYRANRKAEGAHIASDFTKKPQEVELLNYQPEVPATTAKPKATKKTA